MNKFLLTGVIMMFLASASILFVGDPTSHYGYHLLLKNLWWAALPIIFSYWFDRSSRAVKWVIFCMWLLLIPNSFYLMSDLYHPLKNIGTDVDIWRNVLKFDFSEVYKTAQINILRFVLFGLTGWSLGMGSVHTVFQDVQLRKHRKRYTIILSILIALGIMIGREYRLFSYDLFLQPHKLFESLVLITQSSVQLAVITVTAIVVWFFLNISTTRFK